MCQRVENMCIKGIDLIVVFRVYICVYNIYTCSEQLKLVYSICSFLHIYNHTCEINQHKQYKKHSKSANLRRA